MQENGQIITKPVFEKMKQVVEAAHPLVARNTTLQYMFLFVPYVGVAVWFALSREFVIENLLFGLAGMPFVFAIGFLNLRPEERMFDDWTKRLSAYRFYTPAGEPVEVERVLAKSGRTVMVRFEDGDRRRWEISDLNAADGRGHLSDETRDRNKEAALLVNMSGTKWRTKNGAIGVVRGARGSFESSGDRLDLKLDNGDLCTIELAELVPVRS